MRVLLVQGHTADIKPYHKLPLKFLITAWAGAPVRRCTPHKFLFVRLIYAGERLNVHYRVILRGSRQNVPILRVKLRLGLDERGIRGE